MNTIRAAIASRSPFKRAKKPAKAAPKPTEAAPKPKVIAAAAEPKIYPSARAQRPIGLFYDELSRGINPFSIIESSGICDVTDSTESIAEKFNKFGLVKVRRVYSREASHELQDHCIRFHGLQPTDFSKVYNKEKKCGVGGTPVLKDPAFWPYAANQKIKEIIFALLGENSFEFGSAVAAHYSARGLHRDFRDQVENDNSPYSAKNRQKRIIRILHYCGLSGGALGYIPFSHNEQMFAEQSKRVGLTYSTAWFDRHREVLTRTRIEKDFVEADEIERHICWANTDPGDVIISNSAMLHCGEYLTGPRYFFVSTYAESNEETLPRAKGQAGQVFGETGVAYHRFMSEQGFKGSDDILRANGIAV